MGKVNFADVPGARNSANDIAEDLFNQLYFDAPDKRLFRPSDAFLHHQPLRIARSSSFLNRRFRLSGVLLAPLATFGGISVHIIPPPKHSQPAA